jgi:hypothetical protein
VLEECDQVFPVQRRPVAKLECERVSGLGIVPLSTKGCGTHAVTFLHQSVESPQAGKTARHGHLDDREARVGEQPLGKEQPMGLGDRDRGNPEFGLEDAPQVTIRHP